MKPRRTAVHPTSFSFVHWRCIRNVHRGNTERWCDMWCAPQHCLLQYKESTYSNLAVCFISHVSTSWKRKEQLPPKSSEETSKNTIFRPIRSFAGFLSDILHCSNMFRGLFDCKGYHTHAHVVRYCISPFSCTTGRITDQHLKRRGCARLVLYKCLWCSADVHPRLGSTLVRLMKQAAETTKNKIH